MFRDTQAAAEEQLGAAGYTLGEPATCRVTDLVEPSDCVFIKYLRVSFDILHSQMLSLKPHFVLVILIYTDYFIQKHNL